MRHEVELVATYLDDVALLRGMIEAWAASPEAPRAHRAADALSAHRDAVRSELGELAWHILPGGAQLKERLTSIHRQLSAAAEELTGAQVKDPAALEAALEKALAEERALLVDDVLPMLIGSLEEDELREVERDFRARLA